VELPAQGLNSWVRRSDFSGTLRSGSVSLSILDKGYIGTGQDSSGTLMNDFWEYDPLSDTWSQKADFAGTARIAASGFGIDSAGYIGMGYDGIELKKDLWKYMPLSNTWSAEQDLGMYSSLVVKGRRDASVAVSLGKAYLICGYDGTTGYVKQCWQFNPRADTSWSVRKNFMNVGDFTTIGRRWGTAFSINMNSSIYFGTGYDHYHDYQKDLWKFNTATNVWSQVADLPGQTRANAGSFSLFGKGYIFCGTNTIQQFDMWRFDPVLNSWTRMADYPGSGTVNNSTFVINNRAYVGLGTDYSYTPFAELWEYIPDSTTGIEEIKEKVQIIIFPNPVKDFFKLRINMPLNYLPLEFSLYDCNSKLCFHKSIHGTEDRISRGALKAGIYFYSIKQNNSVIHRGKILFD
jgi:hypothetical protein